MNLIKKRLISGFGANVIGQFINLIIQLISIPLFLKYWDVEMYGEWIILSSIPAFLAMADLGFTSAAGNEMTLQVGASRKDYALEIFQSTLQLLNIISLICIVFIVIISFLPLKIILNIKTVSEIEVNYIIICLIIQVICQIHCNLISVGFRSNGENATGVWIVNFFQITSILAITIGLNNNSGPVQIAVILLASKTLQLIISIYLIQQKSKWLRYGYKSSRFQTIKEMSKKSIIFLAFPAGNILKNQGLLMAIGSILGPTAVVVFSSTKTMVNGIAQIMNVINNSVMGEISLAYGAGNLKLVSRIHKLSCQFAFITTLFCVLILGIFGEKIIDLWTHSSNIYNQNLLFILLLGALINSIWNTGSVVLYATNNHKSYAIIFLFIAIVTLFLAKYLMENYEILGAAISVLIFEIILAQFVMSKSLNLLNDKIIDLFKFKI